MAPGDNLDIAQEMMRLTMAIAAKVLFSADTEIEARALSGFLTAALEATPGTLPFVKGLLAALHPRRKRRFQWGRNGLEEMIDRLIVKRRNDGERPADLLSMLLEMQETEPGMTDQQVRDELMTFFVAGHESTSNALTWTWYLLAGNPDMETKFHAELDAVLGGALPTVTDLPQLSYTRMVLSESLRLYPPLWIVARRPRCDMEIGGYQIPARSHLFMSPWVTHRCPRFFPDPERFDPERWLPEAFGAREKFCYFPFGGGPRQCIGEGFGWTEGILLMATIGQRWRMRLAPGQRVEPEPLITLRPKNGMRMILHQR